MRVRRPSAVGGSAPPRVAGAGARLREPSGAEQVKAVSAVRGRGGAEPPPRVVRRVPGVAPRPSDGGGFGG